MFLIKSRADTGKLETSAEKYSRDYSMELEQHAFPRLSACFPMCIRVARMYSIKFLVPVFIALLPSSTFASTWAYGRAEK